MSRFVTLRFFYFRLAPSTGRPISAAVTPNPDNKMNSKPEPTFTEEERADIIAGLEQLRRNNALRPLYGARGGMMPRTRQQIYLTGREHRAWQTTETICSLAVGRPISKALAFRVALTYLLATCAKAIADPVVMEKLKADILAACKDRAKEPERG